MTGLLKTEHKEHSIQEHAYKEWLQEITRNHGKLTLPPEKVKSQLFSDKKQK